MRPFFALLKDSQEFPILWFHTFNIATMAYTSNVPQNDIDHGLGFSITVVHRGLLVTVTRGGRAYYPWGVGLSGYPKRKQI